VIVVAWAPDRHFDFGFGIWDLGFGIWDCNAEEAETRPVGRVTLDLGFGIWDFGLGIWDMGLQS
jgi:hypothetical protein